MQKAARITAIDAIRKTDEIKCKGKIRTPFIITKLFGFEGDIAFKNLRRNGRKSRTIIACICICAVLFLSCNYFCETFKEASNLDYEIPYQIMYQYSAESKAQLEKARNYLKTNKSVKRFYSIWAAWYSPISRNEINPYDNSREYDMSFHNESIFVDKYKFVAAQDITYTAHLLDDEDFNALCKKNGIDYKKYYSPDKDGSIKTIVINTIDRNGEPIFNNNLLGKTIGEYGFDFDKTERENKLDEDGNQISFFYKTGRTSIYKFCDFIKYDKDNPICNLESGGVAFYAPMSVYDKLYDVDDFYFDYGIETDEPYKVEKELKDYLSENEADGDAYNIYYWTMREKSIISAVQFLSYSFILLITLITVFNIINTMTAQIAGRKKELAMLKSVGMTPKEFKKTILLESAFYGLFGLFFGVPLSLVINRVVGYIISKDNPIPFSVNIWLYLIACVAVFVIIALTMIYSLKLIKNNSIIDSLKNDTN